MSDPVVATSVALPLLLVVALVWGTAIAWRRSGATPASTLRTALVTATAAVVWLAATWGVGHTGILRVWDRRPAPVVLFVLAISYVLDGCSTHGPQAPHVPTRRTGQIRCGCLDRVSAVVILTTVVVTVFRSIRAPAASRAIFSS